ncbi:MAG TPA: hypothetical protein VKA53_04470, partial [Thermoanaerobaculia bacterium]|nr:hypothetical protein [Thermoanaerobaculia bacterium]
GESDDLSLKVKLETSDNQLVAQAYYDTSTNCSAGSSSSIGIYSGTGGPAGVWTTVHALVPIPSGIHSVSILLDTSNQYNGSTFIPRTTSWDDVYFGPEAPTVCSPSSNFLCLDDTPGDQRFLVATYFQTVNGGGSSGLGNAISLAGEGVGQGGIFWFFSHANPEMLVKVHNACASSKYFWVFVSAGTNAGVDLYVADTVTGAVAFFHNPDLGPYPSIHDFTALPCN